MTNFYYTGEAPRVIDYIVHGYSYTGLLYLKYDHPVFQRVLQPARATPAKLISCVLSLRSVIICAFAQPTQHCGMPRISVLIAVALALSIAAESSHPIIARSVHNETRIKLSTQGIMEKKPRSLLKRVKKSLIRHASSAAEHSSYVAAVAARSGKQLWHSRNVAAAFLVRFRLIAFTSEFGESFRPLMALWKVNLAYAVSWTYVILDVLLRAADELALRGRTLRVVRTFLFFSIFHSIATMLIPAVVIHSSVHQVDHVLAKLLPMAAASTAASAAPNTAEEQSLWSSVAAAAADSLLRPNPRPQQRLRR